MIIIGLDLSLTGTGFVKIKDGAVAHRELIKSSPSGKTPKDETKRILKIEYKIGGMIDEEEVNLVVIEGLSFMSKGTSLVQLAGLNYFIRKRLCENMIPFLIVAPTSLKKFITGKGNIHKELMLMETFKKYNVEFLENNTCDAFGLAKIGEALLEGKNLPQYQQEVVNLLKKQL